MNDHGSTPSDVPQMRNLCYAWGSYRVGGKSKKGEKDVILKTTLADSWVISKCVGWKWMQFEIGEKRGERQPEWVQREGLLGGNFLFFTLFPEREAGHKARSRLERWYRNFKEKRPSWREKKIERREKVRKPELGKKKRVSVLRQEGGTSEWPWILVEGVRYPWVPIESPVLICLS